MSHLRCGKCDMASCTWSPTRAASGTYLVMRAGPMKREKIRCTMCGLDFLGRYSAKTCSPRCRKRRQRVLAGQALATWKMGEPPSASSSRLWR